MPDHAVPMGAALDSSDEELHEGAEVRREDLILALAWLRLYAPELARMAEAEPYDRDELILPLAFMAGLLSGGTRYLYMTQRGLFYDLRRRQSVDSSEVRRLLDRALDRGSQGARNQVFQIRTRAIDLTGWELGMRQTVKQSTVAAHLTATGGTKRTHMDALAKMQDQVRAQYEFLRNFAKQIQTGAQPLNGQAVNRAAAYVQSARGVHMEARAEVAIATGFDQRKSIRFPGDSCKGCVAMSTRGWVALDDSSYVPIGKRECLNQCRCDEIYRNSATGEQSDRAPRVRVA